MELPKRKRTRLEHYDYSQNGAYFVTISTHNRQNLFGKIVGDTLCGLPNSPDLLIKKWLFELENKYKNVTVDYYVIMPDHIHFILFISGDKGQDTLHQMMDWFKTMTTNEYIKGVKAGKFLKFQKHIWQRSLYDRIIRNDKELNEKRRYIENNPLKPYERDF